MHGAGKESLFWGLGWGGALLTESVYMLDSQKEWPGLFCSFSNLLSQILMS